MKRIFLTFFYLFLLSIVVKATDTEPLKDIIDEGHSQVIQFVKKNEAFKKQGLLDSLNYIYVYVPGEEFDFYRTVDDQLNIVSAVVQEFEWILDEDNKLAETLATKLNDDLVIYNNKKIFTEGPNSEWDQFEYFQQYLVIVDGPKNFPNGNLNSIPDKIGLFSQVNWIESVVNNILDYHGKYSEWKTNFANTFPLPEIFDAGDEYKNSIIFAFTNPQLMELSGVAAESTSVDKVNVHVHMDVKQISEPNSFEEILEDVEFKVYLPGLEIVAAPITGLSQGLLSVKEFIYDQIKAIHGQDVPTAVYYDCEYYKTKLNYDYSKTWFNIKCALHPNHKGYQSFIRESASFLELIAYYGKEDATILGSGLTYKQFVDAKIDKYVMSPDFAVDVNDPNQYLVWLLNEYEEHETIVNKIQHYVRVYYRYFIQTDQQSGEEIINATKAMFSQIQLDGITWWEWYNKKFDLGNEDKTEDAWKEFYNGLISLNTGAYDEDIYQQMYEIISVDINLLWDHVLLPIPRSGQGLFQGVKLPWVGVNSMDMGTELSKFIIKYYQETGQVSKLMLDENEFENFVPFVVHGTLNTNWGVWGGLPYLETSFVAMDYSLVDGNISFEYCVQKGIPPASRYNCSDEFYTGVTTLKTFEGATKPFFDMVYNVKTEAQDYIDESDKIKDVKNAFIEPAFYTALKIVNRDFDRKLEYAAAGVSIALLPYTASAAGIGSLYEFLYFGGLVADVNFTILNVAGTQNTQEYFESVYGEEKGQDYYNYFVTGNTILAGGAFAGGAVKISASAYAKMKAVSDHFDDVYIYNYTKELPYTENSTGLVVSENGVAKTKSVFTKFDKDFKSAFSEVEITDLVYNAKSGMYEVPDVSSTLMLSEEASGVRQVLDRARYEIARLPAPQGTSVTPAYQISNSIAELSVNGKLPAFMSDMNSGAAGFKNYFSYCTTVEEFAKKVGAWKILNDLGADPILRQNFIYVESINSYFNKFPDRTQIDLATTANLFDNLEDYLVIIPDIVNNSLVSGTKFEDFVEVSGFNGNFSHSEYSFHLFKNENWNELEAFFITNEINPNKLPYDYSWPPNKGGFNIISNLEFSVGSSFDRYGFATPGWDGEEIPPLGGAFTSPIINNTPFSFEARALNLPENTYDFYYHIEVVGDIPFNGIEGDVIPWFGQDGYGKQTLWNIPKEPGTPYSMTWNKLAELGYVKITIKSSPSGNYPDLVNTVIE